MNPITPQEAEECRIKSKIPNKVTEILNNLIVENLKDGVASFDVELLLDKMKDENFYSLSNDFSNENFKSIKNLYNKFGWHITIEEKDWMLSGNFYTKIVKAVKIPENIQKEIEKTLQN